MKGDALPDSDRIARYCRPGTLDNEEPSGTSFRMREQDACLSVNWVEYWEKSELDAAMRHIQEDLSQDLELSPNGLFAVLNVGQAKMIISAVTRQQATITHEPTRVRSHAEVCGYKRNEFTVSAALALAVSAVRQVAKA